MSQPRFAASLGLARTLLLAFLLLTLAAPLGAQQAPDLPLEQALRRDGVVLLAIPPAVTESGLTLNAMGSDAAVDEQAAASIWRIRNLDHEPRDVVLESANGEGFWGLRLDAREEAWIRSPDIAGDAPHRLRHQDQVVAELGASSLPFSATNLIAQPALRNRAPMFRAAPQRLLDAGHGLRFDPAALDLDGDPLQAKPADEHSDLLGRQDPPRFEWWPDSEQVGEHLLGLQLEDVGESVAQLDWRLRVVEDFCAIYPIALPQDVLQNLPPGSQVERLPRKIGVGGFAWLSWTGDNDAPTLAASLLEPGDSWRYRNPDNVDDSRIDSGDFMRSAPGSMNSAAVRDQLDQLLGRTIVVPVWDTLRGQGNKLAYRNLRFVSIRLNAYQLTGQGWLSFEYLGEYDRCYNDPPRVTDLQLETPRDTSLAITLEAEDREGDELSFRIVQAPEHGELEGEAPDLLYVPAPGFVGEDVFTYVANDGEFDSREARVAIQVLAPDNSAPQAEPQSLSTAQDTALAITLGGTDADGDSLRFDVLEGPAHGSLEGEAPQLTFTPAPGFHGEESFSFQVFDGELHSAPATIAIQVIRVNQAPVAEAQSLAIAQDTPLAITLGGSDANGDVLSFEVLDGPAHGSLAGEAPHLTYTPEPSFHGADSFSFRVFDGELHSAAATLAITVERGNTAPLAQPQMLSTPQDIALAITLSGSDAEGDALAFEVVAGPSNGSLSGEAPNLSYIPAPGFHGEDSLSFRAFDGELYSALAPIAIEVRRTNQAPVADPLSLSTAQDTPVAITLTGSGPDGDALSFELTEGPSYGSLQGEAPNLIYTPSPGFHGEDSFGFRVFDGEMNSEPARVDIVVLRPNVPPRILSTSVEFALEGSEYQYSVHALDPDAGDAVNFALDQAPAAMSVHAENGLISWPVASHWVGGVEQRNTLCRSGALPGIFDPVELWRWRKPDSAAGRDHRVLGPVSVAQMSDDNGDGVVDDRDIPDVVFVSQGEGIRSHFNIISGADGTQILSTDAPNFSYYGSLALADLTGDGRMEIVGVGTNNRSELIAVRSDGSELWRVATGPGGAYAGLAADAVSIADLDADGIPEIVHGRRVYGAGGEFRWQGAAGHGGEVGFGIVSIAADLNGDGKQEVIAGRTAYRADGSILWDIPASLAADGFNAVGNFNDDPHPEVVLVGSGRVSLLRHDGTFVWHNVVIPGGGHGGPPTVADFDGDGVADIGVAGSSYYSVFNADGSVKWSMPVGDHSSNRTGSSVFDFDQDGRAEVVYADEVYLRVYDGASGAVRMQVPVGSITTLEYPVVVDVNGDGSANILVGGALASDRFGVFAFGSATRNWAPTRKLWNQHSYHIDNINDDGSVPAQPGKSWLEHNTYRLNALPGGFPGGKPDLAGFDLRLVQTGALRHLSLRIRNRGMAATDVSSSARFGMGASPETVQWLGNLEVPELQPGEVVTLNFELPADVELVEGVFAAVDPDDLVEECIESNNRIAARIVVVRATDEGGLYDTQTFSVGVQDRNDPPAIVGASLPSGRVETPYLGRVSASDPDVGDALRYELIERPIGMLINDVSGEIVWTPLASQAGPNVIEVRVSDLRGVQVTQRFQVEIAPNHPPRFESTPPLEAQVGVPYSYTAQASDQDGDSLHFDLVSGPAGMSFDEGSGQLFWTPAPGQEGDQSVVLNVSDVLGASDTQTFSVTVSSSENQTPSILSQPPLQVRVGIQYHYAVQGEDPDGDVLGYSLLNGPSGMSIDTATGVLNWTPTETGHVQASIRVSDGQAWIEQSWTITILPADATLAVSLALDPALADEGQPVGISVLPQNNVAPLTVDLRLEGAPLSVDADLRASLVAGPPGSYAVSVTISDGVESASAQATLIVRDPNAAAPTVRLIEPAAHATQHAVEITAPTPIIAEITGDVGAWQLVRRERGGTGQQVLASGTGAFAAQELAVFDPTLQVNGLHELILQATGLNGETVFDSRVLRVTGDMKLGHFSIAFEEATVPLAGIPVTVTRSYDTRRAHESLDFGHGWTVDASSVRLQESRAPGLGWEVHTLGSGLSLRYCVLPYGSPIVTVTLPDGQVESFQAKASPECSALVPATSVQLTFEPMPGTYSRLEAPTLSEARVTNGNLVEISQPDQPIDPQAYRLTTAEGLVFDIDQSFGLQQLSDPASGQHLSFTRDGVLHSSGIGIAFVRDAAGRIVRMELPDETAITYAYTPAGDLESVTDQVDNVTRFGYVADPRWPHYLQDIIDPRNIRVARNEYDDDGRLVASIDADGHRIEFNHDVVGRVQRIKDRRGFSSVYLFDERGRVLSETNALQQTTTRTYNDFGNELTRTDALNRTTRWTYDDRGNAETETNHLDQTTTSRYNARNQLETQHDAAGRLVMSNVYDIATGTQLTETRDALNNVTGFVYDTGPGTGNSGGLARLTDAAGASTRFEYSVSTGFKIAEIDANDQRTDYINDRMGRVLSETRTRSLRDGSVETLTTRYTYDDKGRLTGAAYPDGSTSSTEYGPNDQPTRECDALLRCTVTTYDDRGHVQRIDYPDASFETRGYDENGNLTAQTDRLGRSTTMRFDAANRLVETIYPDDTPDTDDDNPRTKQRYNAAGELVESEDELGRITQYRYDDAGRQTHVIAPHPETGAAGQGTVLETVYDEAGRREASIDPSGAITRYVYDAAGRLTETIHPDPLADDGDDSNNPRTRTDFDAVGRKTADTDEAGRITRYAYDKLGRLVAVVLPNPQTGANPELIDGVSPDAGTLTTSYAYDEAGNKTQQIDAEGRVTRFEYDSLGREVARVLPEGQRETKIYNDAGELESHTDFNAKTTRYHYGDVGQLERIEYPADPDVRFEYNAAGERERAIDARGTSHSAFDERGRLLSKNDADGGMIEYEYDAAGNLLARISPSQSLVYEYDALNRLHRVTRSVDGEAPTTTRYEYDANGRRSAMVGGDGIRTEYAYDRRNRLTGLLKKTTAGAMLLAMGYTVDASGMRTDIEELDTAGLVRTVEYQYDPVKRLVSETIDHREDGNDRVSTWTYDRTGNRLTQAVVVGAGLPATTAYTYDKNDRLLTETTDGAETTYTYDDNGNTLSKTGPDGSVSYTYNDANRLIRASNAEGITAYVYDADGLRVRQTHAPTLGEAVTTWYVQDNNYAYAQVIEAYESVGAGAKRLAATYTFADDLVSQTRYDEAGNSSTSFVQMDGFGSTRWLTDSNGTITDAIDYDAFGNTVRREGSTAVEHLYRGERFDALLDAYDLRARLYTPGNARFLTQDTFRGFSVDPQSLHKYTFNHNNPISRIDPSGNISVLQVVGAGVNMITSTLARVGAGYRISTSVGGAAVRAVGMVTQRAVSSILRRLVGGGQIAKDIVLHGQGGRRIIDFWVQVQGRILALEVKYGVPAEGSAAMARLVGQMQTATTQVVAAEYRVALFTWQAPTAAQQAVLLRALGPTASHVETIHGALNLVTYVRNFFMVML